MSDPEEAFRMRYGALWASALSVCYLGAHGAEAYDEALTALLRATRVLEALVPPGDRGRGEGRNREHCDIADPPIVRSKGAPKGSTNSKNARRCGRCKGVGHDRQNCDYVEDEHADSPEEEGSGAGEVRHQGSQKRQRRTRH
ncbi:hypothetical protein PIB30_107823 [Stylosanthes scabra]|uniref:Uncharacterized protein n=1 Tax=Stylosanthes scabra TaxID=79078 RepID=A0ABU6YXD4_9FABA|nr:hypothetical protein [Stylosanthes scabra]